MLKNKSLINYESVWKTFRLHLSVAIGKKRRNLSLTMLGKPIQTIYPGWSLVDKSYPYLDRT